jgi:hypothetical protein
MKTVLKSVAIASAILASSTAANAEEGYIRVGEKCYLVVGDGPSANTFQIPCPRDLSEYP